MRGRPVPPLADERRIRSALRACEHISTEALESGLVRDALEELGLMQVALGFAADVAAKGKNPAEYVDLAGVVRHSRDVSARLEASGFAEAMNKEWERRTGESLDDQPPSYLVPLRDRRTAA